MIEKKGPAVRTAVLSGTYPELPKFTNADGLKRTPGLAEWSDALKQWAADFEGMLMRERRDSTDPSRIDIAQLLDSLSGIPDQVEALQASVTTLAGDITDTSGLQELVDNVSAALLVVQQTLNAHLVASIVHGTTSPVVGESDAQSLDRKRIGFALPGYGRFTALMSKSQISSNENVLIPLGYQMLVGNPFTVNGTLRIDGTLQAI